MVAIGSTIHVPADQPTIQQAIDAAVDGDVVVLVSPGTYNENIDFKGKAITVRSIAGPNATVFRGDQTGPVVTCATKRRPRLLLERLQYSQRRYPQLLLWRKLYPPYRRILPNRPKMCH